MPTDAFWVPYAYYLRQERWFRALYDKVRAEPNAVEPFSMKTCWPPARGASLWATFFSPTQWVSHSPLVMATVVAGLVLALRG